MSAEFSLLLLLMLQEEGKRNSIFCLLECMKLDPFLGARYSPSFNTQHCVSVIVNVSWACHGPSVAKESMSAWDLHRSPISENSRAEQKKYQIFWTAARKTTGDTAS